MADMTPDNNAAIDAWILEHVPATAGGLVALLQSQNGGDFYRAVDRSLQRLRKAKKLSPRRAGRAWEWRLMRDQPDASKPVRFFLDQDNSSHWYIVPESKRAEWEAWANLPEDDEASWNEPEWARRLDGGPNQVTFADPKGGGADGK